jgi:hypothetical protein
MRELSNRSAGGHRRGTARPHGVTLPAPLPTERRRDTLSASGLAVGYARIKVRIILQRLWPR